MALMPARLKADFYSNDCQTIRLHGRIENAETLPKDQAVQVTLSYQLSFQAHPSYILINVPLGQSEFEIIFAGYRPPLPEQIHVPLMFIYPREVKFHYYAKTADGKRRSETRQTTFVPASFKIEEDVDCRPDLDLDPLKLR
ncbi:MAG TPA: hypothetical protein DF383_07310 [Deltaproteobacteria bacterium]|nr:hypothetical protein [Deltaproteobacteria bacterium]